MNTYHLDVTRGTPFHLERAVLPGVYGHRCRAVANVSSAHGVTAGTAAFRRSEYGLFTNATSTVAGAARMAR